MKEQGLDLLFGTAAFVDANTIEVTPTHEPVTDAGAATPELTPTRLTADTILINCGTRPAQLPIPGLQAAQPLDSTSVMELDHVPAKLLVLGGGYIGCEFAQMFRRFGSEVIILQKDDTLLSREDPEVAEKLAEIFKQDGIEIHTGVEVVAVHGRSGDTVSITISSKSGEIEVSGSHLLAEASPAQALASASVAIGRTPNSDLLQLEAAGVETKGRGTIPVNDQFQTNVPNIYAMGDITGGPMFTHISYDDYRLLKRKLVQGETLGPRDRMVPYTVFTDPQLGRIGLTEKEAREQNLPIQTATIPMDWVARALEMDESRGLMKAVVHAETQQILGAAILGIEGGELMAVLQMAMVGQVPYPTLRDMIWAHPTLAESFNTLFGSVQ